MDEYKKRLTSAASAITALGAGVSQCAVQHDNDCGIWRRLKCRCDPDITLRFHGVSYQILADGTLKQAN